MKLSQRQIAALWIVEGGPKNKADEYSAIMMPESGGDTKIYNGICCYGVAQLNVRDGIASKKCALNARCSVRKSIALSNKGEDWTPWQAYTEGKHTPYLGKSGIHAGSTGGDVTDALKGVYGFALDHTPIIGGLLPGVGGGSINPLSGIDSLAASVESIARLIEELFKASFWVRFGKGLLGALLIIYALQGMMKATLGIDVATIAKAAALK
jgi:hypothetical protein